MANKNKFKKNKKHDKRFKYNIGDEVLAKDIYMDTDLQSEDEPYVGEVVSRNVTKYGNLYIVRVKDLEEKDYRIKLKNRVLRENQILGFAVIK